MYYVYILAAGRNGTFYVGMTNDIARRAWEHKNKVADGFTKKYGIDQLAYFEAHADVEEAIRREKSIKRWTRAKKMRAIEQRNPDWKDLYFDLNV